MIEVIMIRYGSKLLILILIFFFFISVPAYADWFFDIEGGYVWPGYIKVRVPNETGTLFSLVDDLPAESKFVYRLRLGYQIHPKHSVSILYAPFRLNAGGNVGRDISFNGDVFPANSEILALYKFNSYRVTYRYDFINSKKWKVGLGFTAKVRDAEVRLEDTEKSSSNTDFGFVPLLHFRVEWIAAPRMGLVLKGDALASPGGQGRAEDVQLAFCYRWNDNLSVRAGYRILEGGANVESVYNFTLVHYVIAGVVFRF
jgi:hypothetical protein